MDLKRLLKGKAVFVGVGNPMRGDDGVGPFIAGRIRDAINAETVPENYISKINRMMPDSVIIFDALDFGGEPGEIKVVHAGRSKGILLSTHSLPLSKFSEMVEPAEVWLIGIQPRGIGFGEEMSEDVRKSGDVLAGEVNDLLGGGSKKRG